MTCAKVRLYPRLSTIGLSGGWQCGTLGQWRLCGGVRWHGATFTSDGQIGAHDIRGGGHGCEAVLATPALKLVQSVA